MDIISDLYLQTIQMRKLQRRYVQTRQDGRQDFALLRELRSQETRVDVILERIRKGLEQQQAIS